MVLTEKEKSKDDLDDAIFKLQDKQEDVDELLAELEEAQQPQDNADKALINGEVNSTLIELVAKWKIVVACYMNFCKVRSDEEDEKQAMKECTTRYKFLMNQFVEIKHSVVKAVEELDTMTVSVQRTALLIPKSDVLSNTPNHTITRIITFPQKASPVSDTTLASGVSWLARGEVRVKGRAAKLNQFLSTLFMKQAKAPAETPLSTSSLQAIAHPRIQTSFGFSTDTANHMT